MGTSCENEGIDRRNLLRLGAAGVVALGIGGVSWQARAAEGTPTPSAHTPDESLAWLKEGNADFVSHPELCSIDLETQRSETAGGQAPWATIVSCADSRVPPELIFGGHGLGELFVARNAGNLVDTGTMGTVEYGSVVLGSPLVVVLAHTSCGAVKAACDVVTKNATYPGSIGPMIDPILPSALAMRDTAGDFVNNTAMESARRTAARLLTASALLADLAAAGTLKVVAAIYDLQSGVVTYLD